MPCGPSCSCHGTGVECLSVVDPVNFRFFADWCGSGDEVKRRYVRDRSRIAAETGHVAAPVPAPVVPAAPQDFLAGDLVAALTHRIGADRLAKWLAAKLGVDCGCAARAEALNRLDASLRRYLTRGTR